MPMIQIPIDDASDQQLVDFAEQVLGLTLGDNERTHVLGQMAAAWDKPHITVFEELAPAEGQYVEPELTVHSRMEGGAGADDPKVVVKIGQTTLPGGRDPVPVSVNGKAFVVQRNMNVELPYRFYLALAAAVRAEVHQDKLEDERYEVEFHAYPMQVMRGPSEEEVRAWHARVDHELMPA